MRPEEYIQSQLDKLKQSSNLQFESKDLSENIFKAVMSKKFRKYSVNPEYIDHIKEAIKLNVEKNEPIKFTLVFGGYKLWRLNETPEVDWAELFSMIYYTNWVKPICEIYKPGVWFDFFSDDVIVPQMNNIDPENTKAYQESFKKLLEFIKPYLPHNLSITLNRVGDQYESLEAFQNNLEENKKAILEKCGDKLPELNEEQKATVELNVRLRPGQDSDPNWREKVQLVHDAYAQSSKRRPYYRTEDKLMVITRPIPNSIAVGTTKHSVMKFWIGAGVLEKNNESFNENIFSPKQLENNKFKWDSITIPNLEGKNFTKIRVK